MSSLDRMQFETRMRLAQAVAVLAMCLFASRSMAVDPACPGGAAYSVRHTVRAHPTQGGQFDVVRAAWNYHAFARARVDLCDVHLPRRDGQITLEAGDDLIQTAGQMICFATCAVANSKATVLSLTPDDVSVTLAETGSVIARVPPGRNASAFARSTGQVGVLGGTRMRNGQIEWQAQASFSPTVSGQRGDYTGPAYKDPLVARKTNRTTGETIEKTLLAIEADPMNGPFSWENDTLATSATNLRFKIVMDSDWTVQQGTLNLEVQHGIVTSAFATGAFAGTSLPTEGSLAGDISVPLSNTITIDFDMGGSDTDDLETELNYSGGGVGFDADSRLPVFKSTSFVAIPEPDSYVTEYGIDPDGADISQVETPSTMLGYNLNVSQFHIADDFTVPPGQTWQLSAMMVPLIDPGSRPEDPIRGANARIWLGTPGQGGFVFAENPTNLLLDSAFVSTFRVLNNLNDRQNAVKETWIDLSWVPPLNAGTYWLEIGALGMNPTYGPFAIPTVPRRHDLDQARIVNVTGGQWQPLIDPSTGDPVRLPIQLFGSGDQF